MLTRLTVSTARPVLDVRIEQSALSAPRRDDEEHSLIVDLDALCGLLLPLPNSSWRRAAGACTKALTPICSNFRSMISSDLDNVAQILLELESHDHEPLHAALPVGLLSPSATEPATATRRVDSPTRPHRKRRRSSQPGAPIVIPSTHPSAPTIVITLSPAQPRETSCRVPYQDQAFGNLLTVPCHPTFNKIHPPMMLDPASLPSLNEWRWRNGHWEAVLPSLKEQEKRGLFSKPVSLRKRSRSLPNKRTTPTHQAI